MEQYMDKEYAFKKFNLALIIKKPIIKLLIQIIKIIKSNHFASLCFSVLPQNKWLYS